MDNETAHIKTPAPINAKQKVKEVAGFLGVVANWQEKHAVEGDDSFVSQLWYRGVGREYLSQVPGVYRNPFTMRAERLKVKGDPEEKRLRLEREILSEFRTTGAAFLKERSAVEIYFVAQHFGMPTRLLDWSANPLAALFFACMGDSDKDGFVYAMDARKIIPEKAMRTVTDPLYRAVMTMRHPFVEYAIGLSFWQEPNAKYVPHILPVRPDNIPGRISQQSSCFTLHMHKAPAAENETTCTIVIDKQKKSDIREELHRLNVNEFTIYNDLEHLSKEIKKAWGIE